MVSPNIQIVNSSSNTKKNPDEFCLQIFDGLKPEVRVCDILRIQVSLRRTVCFLKSVVEAEVKLLFYIFDRELELAESQTYPKNFIIRSYDYKLTYPVGRLKSLQKIFLLHVTNKRFFHDAFAFLSNP